MPLNETSGNLTTDAFGGGVAAVPTYIEDVFSTWLYTGNGTSQTITNSIDLSTKGGLVWVKSRSLTSNHGLIDTVRGRSSVLFSDDPAAAQPSSAGTDLTSFNTNGFSIGTNNNLNINNNGATFASWTFRKQPKFFDVVTYTGNGSTTNSISHSLNSLPGFIVAKRTDSTSDWHVVARATDAIYIGGGSTNSFSLNTTDIANNGVSPSDRGITTTAFDAAKMYGGVGSFDVSKTNVNGATYVAYIFAHDAGGFGLTGTDNVISCGSFTTDGSGNATVSLGYEPQWVLQKAAIGTADNWNILDVMRGASLTSTAFLRPNTSSAEAVAGYEYDTPTATGFNVRNHSSSTTYIYIAIRRGPMKVPTDATKVFSPVAYTGTGATNIKTNPNFPPDLVFGHQRNAGGEDFPWFSRLTGTYALASNSTAAQSDYSTYGVYNMGNVGYTLGTNTILNGSGSTYVNYVAQRAPSFFDVVCFDENVVNTAAIPHNLTVVPELAIYKKRSGTSNWITFTNLDFNKYLRLNTTDALVTGVGWAATSTTVNLSQVTGSATSVAYLFATCAGVSKVGSYTGNGTTQTINCGFTGGARFVLIKRTDSTGDWYVYDTARGMTTLTDPYLLVNLTNAETATLGSVTTATTGFALNSTILAAINTNGATFLFLAIA